MYRTVMLALTCTLLVSCTPSPGAAAAPEPTRVGSIADLHGTWRLDEMPSGTKVPDEVEITLSFEEYRVSGTSGCNSYQGEIKETAPGALEPGLLAGTQKYCEGSVMDYEHDYLRALGAVKAYRLTGNRLAIDCDTAEGVETLLFVRSE